MDINLSKLNLSRQSIRKYYKFPSKMTKELARIHAHLCGDGCICNFKCSEKDRKNRSVVIYSNNNKELLSQFGKDMKTVFDVNMSFKKNRSEVLVSSIRIAKFLFLLGKYGSRSWRIPKQIKKSKNEIILEWLKAFFLDEAYIEKKYNRLRVKSMNKAGLMDVKKLLFSLKTNSNITGQNCDGSWYLTISDLKNTIFSDFNKIPSRR